MKHKKSNKKEWVHLMLAAMTGMTLYLLMTLCTAHLILRESLPEEAGGQMQIAAVCIASFVPSLIFAAAGEHRLVKGIIVGVIVGIGILLIKGVCTQNALWTAHTTLSIGACVLFGALGSCIFHKRNRKTTKRAKRKTVKNNVA